MAFFKRKASTNSSMLVNVEDVYVATATITSSHNDGSGWGPRCVTWSFWRFPYCICLYMSRII